MRHFLVESSLSRDAGLRAEKKKAWEAEGLEGFKVELRSGELGREKTFLGRERQLGKIERQCTRGLMKQKDNKYPVLGPHVLFIFDFAPVHSLLLEL